MTCLLPSCMLCPNRPPASNGLSPLPSPEAVQARKALIGGDAAHGQAVKLKVSCTASPAWAAAATAQQIAAGAVVDGGSSRELARSSVSNSSSSSDVCRDGSGSSGSSHGTSLATGSPAAAATDCATAGGAPDAVCSDATCASRAQQLTPGRACRGCKPRKVSFHCPALQSADTAKPTVPAGLQAAMAAAAMPPHSHKQQERVSSPGPAHTSDDGSSSIESSRGAATGTCSSSRSKDAQDAALLQPLKLLPALSEPVLLDVTVGASGSDCESSESCCCCCDQPRCSSQSGTCRAAVDTASASNRHTRSWCMTAGAHTGPAGPAACSTTCSAAAASAANAGCTSCPCSCDDGAAVSEPGNTGMLSRSLPTGHKPRLLGSLSSASTGALRVVQLGGCSTAAAGAAATARAGCAGKSMEQQKAPFLKFGSLPIATLASGGSTSPKSLLCSPPKPAMLIQRLRSFARERSCAASSIVGGQHRRHSVDLFPASTTQAAAAACAIGSSDPAAAADSPAECCCQSIPSSPQKPRARCAAAAAAAAAGLASPLAALCKLGGFLSPPTASVAAAHTHSTCSTGPIQRQGKDPGVRTGAAGLSAQSGASSAEAGTAALLVGLAAQPTWAGQQHASSLSSPTSCRSAKGVCLKVGRNT